MSTHREAEGLHEVTVDAESDPQRDVERLDVLRDAAAALLAAQHDGGAQQALAAGGLHHGPMDGHVGLRHGAPRDIVGELLERLHGRLDARQARRIAVEVAAKEIDGLATPVKGKGDIQNVATISANNDASVGRITLAPTASMPCALRSRWQTITGAAFVVVTVVIRALRPRTPV